MKKIRDWSIKDYLAKTSNVFERARIELTYNYAIIFILLGLLFYGNLIANHFWYHCYIIGFGLLSLISIPFVLKKKQNYHLAAGIYLVQQFTVSLGETILQGAPLDITSGLFNILVILFSFFLFGTRKGILISIPFTLLTVIEIINNIFHGTLFDFSFTQGQRLPDQPVFVLVPLLLNIFVIRKIISVRNLAENQILTQHEIIELKNKEITDSIVYAKRIQLAKLPKLEKIKESFPQSFVLYKPKDIISGDFYYFKKLEHQVILAAADCTGHGVPGALVSMLGYEILETAVSSNQGITGVLSVLNKGIKNSLNQSSSKDSTQDGMDIAICNFDFTNRVLTFSGANRPLWVIRKNNVIIEEFKPTKKAIGGFTGDNEQFEIHTIQLAQGDCFYLFSDGYADTFNGINGKKLTTKKFRQLLLTIKDMGMEEQGIYLENFLENWKAGTGQVDDVLVMGVRIK